MPNITSKKSGGVGNSKCGTFCADHHMHPHAGGTHVLPGLHHSSKSSHPHPQSAKGHLHGGHPLPHNLKTHSEPDADERGGRSDHDADDAY